MLTNIFESTAARIFIFLCFLLFLGIFVVYSIYSIIREINLPSENISGSIIFLNGINDKPYVDDVDYNFAVIDPDEDGSVLGHLDNDTNINTDITVGNSGHTPPIEINQILFEYEISNLPRNYNFPIPDSISNSGNQSSQPPLGSDSLDRLIIPVLGKRLTVGNEVVISDNIEPGRRLSNSIGLECTSDLCFNPADIFIGDILYLEYAGIGSSSDSESRRLYYEIIGDTPPSDIPGDQLLYFLITDDAVSRLVIARLI